MYEIANWNTHFCFRKTHHGILWASSRFSLVSHTYFSGYYVIWCETKNKLLFEFVICEGARETQRRLQRGRPDFAPAGSCSLPPRGHAAHARMHAAALLRSRNLPAGTTFRTGYPPGRENAEILKNYWPSPYPCPSKFENSRNFSVIFVWGSGLKILMWKWKS